MLEPCNVSQFVLRHRAVEPEKIAIDEGDTKITFHQLGLMVDNFAACLKNNGILVGDEVILMAEDELLLLVAMLSVSAAGGVSIVLRKSMVSPLLKEQLSDLNPKFFLSDQGRIKLGAIKKILLTRSSLGDHIDKSNDLNNNDSNFYSKSSKFSLIIGSGSTGRSKIFTVTNQQEIDHLNSRIKALNLTSADHVASMTHIEFTAARRNIIAALSGGCTVKLFSKNDELYNYKLICSDVSVLSIPVIALYALERDYSGDKKIFPNLRIISAGGSLVGEDIRKKIDKNLSKNLHIIYGTNELGYLSVAKPENWRGIPGSIGKVIDGVEIQIVDENGLCVPLGQPGLMRFRKKHMIGEYLNSEELTQKYVRDGWFYPNDVGSLDESGNITFLGRADDMMIFNGINIYPAEIESFILRIPGIKDVAALPLRHLIHQDVPVCAVVLQDGFSLDQSDILNWSRAMLGAVAPKHVFIVANIPRDPQGKLLRPQLRELLSSQIF